MTERTATPKAAVRRWLHDLSEEQRWVGGGVLFVVMCIYGPSLVGGFLTYDDPWLVEQNAVLANTSWSTLWAVFTDFSHETRLALGKEYLPVRDLSVFLELAAFGPEPMPMRVFNLLLLLVGSAGLSLSVRRVAGFGGLGWLFVFASLCFHPLHVESVAWISGRKDCLAFAFVGLALWGYSAPHSRRGSLAVVLAICAMFSKGQGVVVGPLLLGFDLLARRKPRYGVLALVVGATIVAIAVHTSVGGEHGTRLTLPAGRQFTLAHTMSVVWLRYVGLAIWPSNQAIFYDIDVQTTLGWAVAVGYATLLVPAALLVFDYLRNGATWKAASWWWFVVPLVPVSQLLVPLPNLMADRYMLFSVFGIAVVVGSLSDRSRRWQAISGLWLIAMAFFSWQHAHRFRSSVELFGHATRNTSQSVRAPAQLGAAYEGVGNREAAKSAYLETLHRAGQNPSPVALRAILGLARTESSQAAAQRWVETAESRWPGHPLIARTRIGLAAR